MLSKKQLQNAITEFNKVMGLNPPLSVDGSIQELTDQIKVAIDYIDPVNDEFTTATSAVIKEFTGTIVEEETTKEVEDDSIDQRELTDAEELLVQTTDAETMAELKSIVKANLEFKELRGKVGSYKTIDALRNIMMEYIGAAAATADYVDQAKEEPQEPVPVKTPKINTKKGDRAEVLYFKRSEVVKGLTVGAQVKFTTAANSQIAPKTVLKGEVVQIKLDINKTAHEVVRIKTLKGMFFKYSNSVELL